MGTKQQQEGKRGAERYPPVPVLSPCKALHLGVLEPQGGDPLWKQPFLGGPAAAGVGLIPPEVPQPQPFRD